MQPKQTERCAVLYHSSLVQLRSLHSCELLILVQLESFQSCERAFHLLWLIALVTADACVATSLASSMQANQGGPFQAPTPVASVWSVHVCLTIRLRVNLLPAAWLETGDRLTFLQVADDVCYVRWRSISYKSFALLSLHQTVAR